MEYRLVFLTTGQQAPEGSTGNVIENGLVWIGEEGSFNPVAMLGARTENDPEFDLVYNYRVMTQEEIEKYNKLFPEPDPLAEQKAALWQDVELALKDGCQTSFGFKIDCEDKNVADFSNTLLMQTAYVNAMSATEGFDPNTVEVTIRAYDNSMHTLAHPQYVQMCLELGQHVMGLRYAYWAAVDAIEV